MTDEPSVADIERMARERLQSCIQHDPRRALFVAVLNDALTSVCRGARRATALRWVNDTTDTRDNGFAAYMTALDEDPAVWRRVFETLTPRPRGRPIPAELCRDIAAELDATAFIERQQLPRPDDAQLERIKAGRYGRRRSVA
jgi:hypothetical protein